MELLDQGARQTIADCIEQRCTNRAEALRIAETILALPELKDARRLPDEWPGETDYARGWNDCRRHAYHWTTPR
jgi:hypothetical protein